MTDLSKRLRAQICCGRSEECQGGCNRGLTLTQVFLQRNEAAYALDTQEATIRGLVETLEMIIPVAKKHANAHPEPRNVAAVSEAVAALSRVPAEYLEEKK